MLKIFGKLFQKKKPEKPNGASASKRSAAATSPAKSSPESPQPSGGLRPVGGAMVASTADGRVLYNMLTPHMQQFLGQCVGAIKRKGLKARGTGQFSILIGDQQEELALERFYQPHDDPRLVEAVVDEALRMTSTDPSPRSLRLKYPPIPANASRFAEDMVEAAREISGVELDYSVGSLEAVDEIIQSMADDGCSVDDVAETLFGFGCYVGEVFVRNGTGSWRSVNAQEQQAFGFPFVIQTGPDSVCNPVGRVFRRLQAGESENLPYFYLVFAP